MWALRNQAGDVIGTMEKHDFLERLQRHLIDEFHETESDAELIANVAYKKLCAPPIQ